MDYETFLAVDHWIKIMHIAVSAVAMKFWKELINMVRTCRKLP